MVKKIIILSGLVCLFCLVSGFSCASVLEDLQQLDPLQKVHYSWPIKTDLIADVDILTEYARITRALSIDGDHINESDFKEVVRVCGLVSANIGINFSPYHYQFVGNDPTDFGDSHKAEIDFITERMNLLKVWIEEANLQYGANVKVKCMILDSERFGTRDETEEGHELWNAAIKCKHDLIYFLSKTIFPDAVVAWYGFGGYQRDASRDGWHKMNDNDLGQLHDNYTVPLYSISEIGEMRKAFKKTVENTGNDTKPVIPWIALASGYKREFNGPFNWMGEWDYDLIYSWQFGAEINNVWYGNRPERYAPWNRAESVIFYPHPDSNQYWWEHFIAYVLGSKVIPQFTP